MGGDTRVVLNLIEGLAARGIKIDLVLASATEIPLDRVQNLVRVIDLKSPLTARSLSTIQLLPALIKYLYQVKPKVLISNLSFTNAIVVFIKFFVFPTPKLILVEHLALSQNQNRPDEPHSTLIPTLMQMLYPKADAIVAVSQPLAAQLQSDYNLKNVHVILNAVVSETLLQKAAEAIDHPWLISETVPVFLGVGRFTTQKDFTTLIQAFSILRQQIPARLILLGEGALRSQLETQIEALGLQDEVALPGFEPNPYPYMKCAAAFVLSSRWEALPTVLIEAMACGCQSIGTRCPYGVEEILADGEFGQLVPVEDAITLAQAMKTAIDSPISPEAIRLRAADFSVDRAVDLYLALIAQLR